MRTVSFDSSTGICEKKESNARNYGIDLLRILMMFLIVLRHGSMQSGVVIYEGVPKTNHLMGVGISCITGIAVNCFILVSGYYLCRQSFRVSRLIKLYGAVLFYSLGSTLISFFHPSFGFSWFNLIRAVFPISTRYSWFMSEYFALVFLSPFLNRGICGLSQKQFLTLLGILLFLFSLLPTLCFPTFAEIGGHTLSWFILLYCAGSYHRIYGKNCSCFKNLSCFFSCCFLMFIYVLLRFLLKKTEIGFVFSDKDNYDLLPTFFASYFCFRLFLDIKIPARLCGVIAKISPLMLGCYLFHSHLLRGVLWRDLLGINKHIYDNLWPVHMFACVCAVFIMGCICEFLRLFLFRKVAAFLPGGKKRLSN